LEQDFLPDFMKKKNVYGYIYDGDFIDIGTPESLKQFRHEKIYDN
jgi:NDP-sugar pyrophosphorylase family protein